MKILFLSSETQSPSTEILTKALKRKGFSIRIEDPRNLNFQLSPAQVFDSKMKPIKCDIVLPRLGMYTLEQGLHVISAFEAMGKRTVNSAESIRLATNKILSASLFAQAHLPLPKTYFFHKTSSLYEKVKFQFPLVLKLPIGSQGKGVAIIHNQIELNQWSDLIRTAENEFLIQEYIQGTDIRALVFKNQVIASISRRPKKNEFRANLSLGGSGKKINLSEKETTLALEAARCLGLTFCGIDFIRTKHMSYLLEANAFPGLSGISQITKQPLAQIITEGLFSERT